MLWVPLLLQVLAFERSDLFESSLFLFICWIVLKFSFVCSEFVILVLESCFGELDLNECLEDLNFYKV